jgi:ribonuclease Y
MFGLALIAFIVGYWARKYIAEAKIASAEEAAKRILEQAEKDGEAKKTGNNPGSKGRDS